jgi:ribosomal protein L15
MPIDPVTGTIIAAGIAGAGQGANAYATGKMNKKSREFSREMYERTKTDNLTNWQMQNEYNSPQQQMQRLKNAGLNPNMLYDKTGAVIPAQNINTPDVQSAQFRTPEFGNIGTGLVQGYFDTKIKLAQYDNFKAQNTVLLQDAALKAAQAAGEVVRTQGNTLDNTFARENLQNALKKAGMETTKLGADIDFTLSENQRRAVMNSQNLSESIQRVKNLATQNINDKATLNVINQNYRNLIKDGTLKQLDINLKKDGVQPTDALWQRIVAQLISDILPKGGLSTIGQTVYENYPKWQKDAKEWWSEKNKIGGVRIW